jgi:hypothetical protein
MKNFSAGFLLATILFFIILFFIMLFTAKIISKGHKKVEYNDISSYMVKHNKSCITFREIDELSKTL